MRSISTSAPVASDVADSGAVGDWAYTVRTAGSGGDWRAWVTVRWRADVARQLADAGFYAHSKMAAASLGAAIADAWIRYAGSESNPFIAVGSARRGDRAFSYVVQFSEAHGAAMVFDDAGMLRGVPVSYRAPARSSRDVLEIDARAWVEQCIFNRREVL